MHFSVQDANLDFSRNGTTRIDKALYQRCPILDWEHQEIEKKKKKEEKYKFSFHCRCGGTESFVGEERRRYVGGSRDLLSRMIRPRISWPRGEKWDTDKQQKWLRVPAFKKRTSKIFTHKCFAEWKMLSGGGGGETVRVDVYRFFCFLGEVN